MPVSLFSPLARGFGAWTGELHLAENDKGAGPSLPSLLQDDPYCHHSGVTVRPRAKSAVSGFSAKSARGASAHESRDGELLLPKTYITKKGAIVLFAAPDDPANVEPSERDCLFIKRARRKLLKNRHSQYSNQIGSVQRLAQSVLSFGDQEEYDKETASVTDAENKVYLKFLKDESKKNASDKHSRPGGNIDMYLNDLLIRSGGRPATAIPTVGLGSLTDMEETIDEQQSVAESLDGSQYDQLSVDSERLVRARSSPGFIRGATEGQGGRTSPSGRGLGKKLSVDKLASSLKSGGFLGRQTILEEIDTISEASSRPYTPASSVSRPTSRSRPYARPLSGEPRYSPMPSQSPLHENTISEQESEQQGLKRESSFAMSNKLSQYSGGRGGSSSVMSGKNESEAGEEELTRTVSRSGSYIGHQQQQESGQLGVVDGNYGEMTNSFDDLLQRDQEIRLADKEIQGIIVHQEMILGEYIEAGEPQSVLRRSSSQVGSQRSSQLRRQSRTSSVQSVRREGLQLAGSPGGGRDSGGLVVGELVQDEDFYLSEDAEEEDDDGVMEWEECQDQQVLMTPVQQEMLADNISLLSGGLGQETFSFEASIADNVPEHQLLVEDPVLQALHKQASVSSVKSDRPSTAVSSVSHLPGSRPQSIARYPSTALDDQQQTQDTANQEDAASSSKSSLVKSEGKSQVLSQVTDSGSGGLHEEIQGENVFVEKAGDDQDERPASVASSHSGVGSVRVESPLEQGEEPKVIGGRAGDVIQQADDIVIHTEALDEAATEPKDTVSSEPSTTTQPLPEYLTAEEVQQPAEGSASVTGSVHRPPSSYTSSVTNTEEELPPEPAVTEVRITPRSSASKDRTPVPPTPETTAQPVVNSQSVSSPVEKPVTQTPPEIKPQPQKTEIKPSLPKPEEGMKPIVPSATKPAEPHVPRPPEVKKEEPVHQSKKEPQRKATHMVEHRPEEKVKPPKPEDKKSQKKPAPAKPDKEKEKKSAAKPEKEAKVKEGPKPPAKTEEKTAKREEKAAKPAKPEPAPVKPAKVSLKPEKKEPEKAPAKEFTKVFDITNYENTEKDNKKTPTIEKPPEPERKPANIVNDTKAELARLFGTPPVKRETEREKKERMRKELGPRTRKPKVQEEPKPPKKTAEEKELDKLEKTVMDAIGAPAVDPDTEVGGGLTVEEMELEQQLLQEKLKEAEAKLTGREALTKPSKSKAGTPRDKKKGKKKTPEQEEDLAKRREELREAKRLEKEKRLAEAKLIEEELRQKEDEKNQELARMQSKTLDIDSDIQAMQQLAEEAERAEEEARQKLQEMRKQAREERERRRREEQERKKEDAIRKKAEEKARHEKGRQREQEMLLRLATKEERMKIAEEERRRKEEEEEKSMMEEEEEERLEKKRMEEEEAKIAELEREIEEQALSNLVEERDQALIKKREMEVKKKKLEDEEEIKRKEYEAEQKKIEDMRLKREEEETQRREEEKRRLMELQRMEEEARLKLKLEMERRREALLRRREQNLERRKHLDGLKGKQGITKPWTFSYYVHWPRETYELRMGGPDDKKKGFGKPKSASAKGRDTHT